MAHDRRHYESDWDYQDDLEEHNQDELDDQEVDEDDCYLWHCDCGN